LQAHLGFWQLTIGSYCIERVIVDSEIHELKNLKRMVGLASAEQGPKQEEIYYPDPPPYFQHS